MRLQPVQGKVARCTGLVLLSHGHSYPPHSIRLCVFPSGGCCAHSHIRQDTQPLSHQCAAAAAAAGVFLPTTRAGSEDNTVRLWNAGGSCLQVIDHPGCVWSVAFTQRGELVSGCSDAVGRVWSNDPARKVSLLAGVGGAGGLPTVGRVCMCAALMSLTTVTWIWCAQIAHTEGVIGTQQVI
jgi:WD40 repeat protein